MFVILTGNLQKAIKTVLALLRSYSFKMYQPSQFSNSIQGQTHVWSTVVIYSALFEQIDNSTLVVSIQVSALASVVESSWGSSPQMPAGHFVLSPDCWQNPEWAKLPPFFLQ